MVLSAAVRHPAKCAVAEPALVVPDTGAWALWGEDLTAKGLVPVAAPAAAEVLVVPSLVPDGLAPAVRSAWAEMPPPRRVVGLEAPWLSGVPVAELLAEPGPGPVQGEHDHGGLEHGDHGGHEHGDHGDMMEITGEPSRDGLVMESIELEHGPLARGLPGGLVLDVELDGDVVASCAARAALRMATRAGAPAAERVPDPLAGSAWLVALRAASGDPAPAGLALAAIECERALSHLAWLGGLAEVLGWAELSGRALEAASPLIRVGSDLREELSAGASARGPAARPGGVAAAIDSAAAAARGLLRLLERARGLRTRARGRAPVAVEEARARALAGPNARASGVAADVRTGDPRYRALGFELRTHDAGDVEARVRQRAGEAVDALRLAAGALATRSELDVPGDPVKVEGPRGPLLAARSGTQPATAAPGSAAARSLAAERAVGLEWASALTVVASFDLSPWEVDG